MMRLVAAAEGLRACVLFAALWLGGCTCVNSPDLSFLDVDASIDPGDGDSDSDGDGDGDGDGDADGDGDGDVDAGPEVCGLLGYGVDEDQDDLVDCQDLDCLDDPACCLGRGTVVLEDFTSNWEETGEWTPFNPEVPPLYDPSIHIDFTDAPNGLFLDDRIDLTYGLEVHFEASSADPPRQDHTCETLLGCGDYVGVALTPVSQVTPGVPLPVSVLVAVTEGGEILVVRGDVIRQHIAAPWVGQQRVGVQVTVLPGGLNGRRGFRVEVAPSDDSEVSFDTWSSEDLFLDESDNHGADGMPGAWLAVVGRTERRSLATMEVGAELLGCDNPAVFAPSADSAITASTLELGSWAEGFIGAPAIVAFGDDEQLLLFDGSDVDLGLERYRPIPRAVGEANRSGLGAWVGEPDPVLGNDPPSAADSFARDPAMIAGAARDAWLVWNDGAELGDTIATTSRARVDADWQPPIVLLPATETGAAGLRSPAVAQAGNDVGTDHYHLWFISVGEQDETSLWHAVGDRAVGPESIVDVEQIVAADAFGGWAARGLSDPMVLWDERREVFLLWILGEDALGRRALLHGVAPAEGRSLELYEGNPVLDPQDPVLGTCDQGCNLRGGTVMEENGRRIFLFARSAGSGTPVQEIVTVTQSIGGDE